MNVLRFFCPRSSEPGDENLRALMRPWLFGLADGPLDMEAAVPLVPLVPVVQEGVVLDTRFELEVAP